MVPVSDKPTYPFTTLDEVVGKQPLIDVDAGAPVTRRYFREGNLLARAIPAGYQAISIRSEEHTSELQSLMRISYAVFCLKKKQINNYRLNQLQIIHMKREQHTSRHN